MGNKTSSNNHQSNEQYKTKTPKVPLMKLRTLKQMKAISTTTLSTNIEKTPTNGKRVGNKNLNYFVKQQMKSSVTIFKKLNKSR